MASTILRNVGGRLLAAKNGTTVARITVVGTGQHVQVATLKATYGGKYPYEKPYPYETKPFRFPTELFDPTWGRFCENTKLIVVEGNAAVGKKEFAKRLAKDFDLKYFDPTPDFQHFIVPENGFDMRSLEDFVPEDLRQKWPYDLNKFYSDPDPSRGFAGQLQLAWFKEKFRDYCRAMTHLLSTGQGVVLVRSIFSDQVFANTLKQAGYMKPRFWKHYTEVNKGTTCEVLKPHLTIYLDAPVDVIKQRIKARNDPREVNSPLLNDKYLQLVEANYKEVYLPKMKVAGEVIEIDWTEVANDADMEMIVEELQLVNLENEDSEDPKFKDWNNRTKDEWTVFRKNFQNRDWLERLFNYPIPRHSPEAIFSYEEQCTMEETVFDHPCVKYEPGWAPELGNNTLLKLF